MSRGFTVVGVAALIALVGCNSPYETTGSSGTDSAFRTARAPEASPDVAPSTAAPSLMDVPAGTIIEVDLRDGLDSDRNTVGEAFSALVVTDVTVEGRPAIPAGSIVRGVVQDLRAATEGGGTAKLALAFTRLEMRGDYATPMIASLAERSGSRTKQDAAGEDARGAVAGTIVGGAIGTGVVIAEEGKQVSLPEGTRLAIKLDEGIKVPRQW